MFGGIKAWEMTLVAVDHYLQMLEFLDDMAGVKRGFG